MHYFYHFVEKNEKKKQKSGICIVQFYIILSSQEK